MHCSATPRTLDALRDTLEKREQAAALNAVASAVDVRRGQVDDADLLARAATGEPAPEPPPTGLSPSNGEVPRREGAGRTTILYDRSHVSSMRCSGSLTWRPEGNPNRRGRCDLWAGGNRCFCPEIGDTEPAFDPILRRLNPIQGGRSARYPSKNLYLGSIRQVTERHFAADVVQHHEPFSSARIADVGTHAYAEDGTAITCLGLQRARGSRVRVRTRQRSHRTLLISAPTRRNACFACRLGPCDNDTCYRRRDFLSVGCGE